MLLGDNGEKIGVIGIAEALHRAQEIELDLVQISKSDNGLSICKIMDFNAWQYREDKKRHQQELKNKSHELKEMWFSPAVDDGDLKVKLKKCEDFLKDGHKVKVTIKPTKGKRNQYALMHNKEMVHKVINQVVEALKEIATVEAGAKSGAMMTVSVILKPEKKPKVTAKEEGVKSENAQPTTDAVKTVVKPTVKM